MTSRPHFQSNLIKEIGKEVAKLIPKIKVITYEENYFSAFVSTSDQTSNENCTLTQHKATTGNKQALEEHLRESKRH